MLNARLCLLFALFGVVSWGQAQGIGAQFPREETLIVHNPEDQNRAPGNFNIWGGSADGWSTGLHQLMFDTLWYIDPDAGIDGAIYNSLASGPAEYNEDFTEMTVPLRQ
jgi:peptide/nickel transport system substrate-binding protein